MVFCHGFDCVVVLTHTPTGDMQSLQTWSVPCMLVKDNLIPLDVKELCIDQFVLV